MTVAVMIAIMATVAAVASMAAWMAARRRAETLAEELNVCRQSQIREHARAEALEIQLNSEREMMSERFKAIATDVLRASSQTLENGSRLGLEAVVAPVKASLEIFSREFKESHSRDTAERAALRQGITDLARLSNTVGEETRRLSAALKGNASFQGRWGEMVLKNVLEKSGLEEGRWLVFQDTCRDSGGRLLRPDAVINCPGDRKIIIDSKVSLTDYLRMTEAENDAAREAMLKAHLRSVENHIKELESKAYQDNVDALSADFVLMFMPHEGAYMAAMQASERLWERAWNSRVIIVSPTHLVAVIKIVEQMWRVDDHNTNALKIAEEATKMADKLVLALNELSQAGHAIDAARASYDTVVARISTGRGSVMRHIDKLRNLGIRSQRAVPGEFAGGDSDEGE